MRGKLGRFLAVRTTWTRGAVCPPCADGRQNRLKCAPTGDTQQREARTAAPGGVVWLLIACWRTGWNATQRRRTERKAAYMRRYGVIHVNTHGKHEIACSGLKIDFRRCGTKKPDERDGPAQPAAVQFWTICPRSGRNKAPAHGMHQAKRKPPRITGTACGLSAAFGACKAQDRGER